MTQHKPDTDYKRSILLGALAGIGLAVVFAAGFFLRDVIDIPAVSAYTNTTSDAPGYPLLDEAQSLIDQIYLRDQPEYMERQ
jgi:hypothetical protein